MKYYRDPNQGLLFVGENLRDAGIVSVARSNVDFILEVCAVIRRLKPGAWTINEVRSMVTITPTHPNAWGAAIRIARQLGLCHTVARENSRRPPAHARSIPVCVSDDDDISAAG
jgi:alpha-galactosidase/6-phospho-beta-glucosidase family protein